MYRAEATPERSRRIERRGTVTATEVEQSVAEDEVGEGVFARAVE